MTKKNLELKIKKYKTAFILFSSNPETRLKIKEEMVVSKFGELGKQIGKKWANLSIIEKQKYIDLSEKDKKLFFEKKSEIQENKNKKPKKALSAYIFFFKEKYPLIKNKDPNLKPSEIVKTIANLWKELDLTNRHKYLNCASEDRIRYQNEKEQNNKIQNNDERTE